jgi:hypothetical protein
MIKLKHILQEQRILIPRRSKEDRSKNHLIATQKKIQQYIKDGSEGDLDLNNAPITSLPNGLTIGGDLDLSRTLIDSLPADLKVDGDLYILYTPLDNKYSREEIKKMVPGLSGRIYT